MIFAMLSLTRLPGPGAEGVRDRETNALLEIRSVIVDGTPVSPRPAEKLRLSSSTRTVTFGFGPTTNAIQQPIRMRFKLDGYDEGWREQAGEMRLCVRFLDGTGDQVNETIFRVVGQSAGWTGNPETASVHASPGDHRGATERHELLGRHVFGRTARHGGGLRDHQPGDQNPAGERRFAHGLPALGF